MAKLTDSLTFRHGATIANRFVQPPMLTNSGRDGFATQDTIDYYAAHSKSGGMIITGYMYVSENGGPALSWQSDREQLAVYDDKFIPQLTKVAQAIKKDGNKAVMQIAHTGREANTRAVRNLPVYAPSAVDYPFLPYKVHAFTDEQVRQVVKDFGAAAKRAIDAGFDGVEIHGANHYLIQQFFSQYSNRRDDHWGGSLAKRMNFPLAVVKAVTDTVKKYAPKDFIVGYRISPEEIHGNNVGYTWHEATKLVEAIVSQFGLDYIHLSMPDYAGKPTDSAKTYAELFRSVLDPQTKEVINGGVGSAEKAADAMNYADMIAVGRATIIDPLFAEKVLTGHSDQIITKISPDQAKQNHMTPGMIDNFSAPNPVLPLAGGETLRPLHKPLQSWSEIQYPNNDETK